MAIENSVSYQSAGRQPTYRFDGKVAFVTGAASGMGRATARLLAASGAAVTLVDRSAEALEQVAAGIRSTGGKALAVVGDVSRADDIRVSVERTVDTFGALNLAANVAGIPTNPAQVGVLDPAEWDRIISINLSGVFYAMRYQIPAMLATGGGAIVNISSVFADRGIPDRPGYAAAKHGIRGLTRTVVVDYAAQGIRVNELQPGATDTPMSDSDPEKVEAFMTQVPAGRKGTPEEIARVVAFLLSDDASYINGTHLAVDGGYLA